jgi:hypothetical protein
MSDDERSAGLEAFMDFPQDVQPLVPLEDVEREETGPPSNGPEGAAST